MKPPISVPKVDHKRLLSASRKFEREEGRAGIYPMALEWSQTHLDYRTKIPGVGSLLVVWNRGYYARAKKGYGEAAEGLSGLFSNRRFTRAVEQIGRASLTGSDLATYEDSITTAYRLALVPRGFGPTAASKILHLLKPRFLMMWDKAILRSYHQGHRNRGELHERGGADCYMSFLREMQAAGLAILAEVRETRLLKELELTGGYSKSLPKALDEFNIIEITYKAQLEPSGYRYVVRHRHTQTPRAPRQVLSSNRTLARRSPHA